MAILWGFFNSFQTGHQCMSLYDLSRPNSSEFQSVSGWTTLVLLHSWWGSFSELYTSTVNLWLNSIRTAEFNAFDFNTCQEGNVMHKFFANVGYHQDYPAGLPQWGLPVHRVNYGINLWTRKRMSHTCWFQLFSTFLWRRCQWTRACRFAKGSILICSQALHNLQPSTHLVRSS